MNTPQGMRPFNLQDWQNGAKPICRNGYEPTDLHYFRNAINNSRPILFTTPEGNLAACNLDGIIGSGNICYGAYDLFLKSQKKEGWVNLYKFGKRVTTGDAVFDIKQEAIDCKCQGYFTTIKIEWYE